MKWAEGGRLKEMRSRTELACPSAIVFSYQGSRGLGGRRHPNSQKQENDFKHSYSLVVESFSIAATSSSCLHTDL